MARINIIFIKDHNIAFQDEIQLLIITEPDSTVQNVIHHVKAHHFNKGLTLYLI